MKKIFKNALALVAVALMACTVNAQEKGEMRIGAQMNYGLHSDYKNPGLGVRYQYCITDHFRIEPSANFFFKKDNMTMWDLNFNLHYVFQLAPKFNIYPLGGLTLLGADYDFHDYSDSDTQFGINLGGGVEYWLTHNFGFNGEVKYQFVDGWDRPVISAGVMYKF